MLIHFDVDKNVEKLLKGNTSKESINQYLSSVPKDDQITKVTVKTQSRIDKQVLEEIPNLKLIVTRTVGIDHIDINECRKRNIAVYNIPDYGPESVAQHTIALILVTARDIISANNLVHQGTFSYKNHLGVNLKNKTIGVIGTGRIGLEVIKISKALGMRIVAFDIYKNTKAATEMSFKYLTLEKLVKKADVITLHLPATKKTHHLINNSLIKLMKKGVILVNTARGELIETAALVKNIDQFHFVALDVVEDELDFGKHNPLLKHDNVIITPHCAFYTDTSIKKIADETALNIKRFQNNSKTNRIDIKPG